MKLHAGSELLAVPWRNYVPWLPRAIAILAVVTATLLTTRTYSVFNQTTDEPIHIVSGLQWLEKGTYDFEPLHPPLARIFAGFGLFAAGVRTQGSSVAVDDGNTVLDTQGPYQRNLTLARLGMLPFFWLACFLLWSFLKKNFSDWHAAIAVLILCFCPPVLAHSAAATTDLPLLAMFLFAILRMFILLQKPGIANAIIAGVAIGLAVATKFSAIPFLFTSAALLIIFDEYFRNTKTPKLIHLLHTLACALLTIWALYRFSVGPILAPHAFRPDQVAALQRLPGSVLAILYFKWMPAPELFRGLLSVYAMNLHGRIAYLLGDTYVGGRWAFFPVAILVKTPIALLILSALGVIYAFGKERLRANKNILVPAAGIAGPLLVAIPSNLNIGLRHILLIYPFVATFAAIAVVELWNLHVPRNVHSLQKPDTDEKLHNDGIRATARRFLVILLLGWNITSCIRATPDFLPYFNEVAAPYASKILVDSDLDWGQDLFRLIAVAQQDHISDLSLAYEGSIDLRKHLPAGWVELPPRTKVSGWVAVSEYRLLLAGSDYAWLNQYQPVKEVGHSIRLYYIP